MNTTPLGSVVNLGILWIINESGKRVSKLPDWTAMSNDGAVIWDGHEFKCGT